MKEKLSRYLPNKETLYKTLGLYNGYHLLKVTPVQLGLINLDTKF